MIQGERLSRPTKTDLAIDIATILDIPVPDVSKGASVDSTFLDAIFMARFGTTSGGSDAYRKTERLLRRFDLTYDPYWDTSESSATGGSTVTARAYSRLRSALTGKPRCFIVAATLPEFGPYRLQYDRGSTGHPSFTDAGPGSRVIFLDVQAQLLTGRAEVEYIYPGWRPPPWEAQFGAVADFATPIPVGEMDMPGWRIQDAVTEITFETFKLLVATAGLPMPRAYTRAPGDDPGGDVVAGRIRRDFTPETVPPVVAIPDDLPVGVIDLAPLREPHYVADDETDAVGGDAPSMPRRTDSERRRDREAERRAVEFATAALEGDGWTLERDCQADGVGYDLRFTKDDRTLKVEVKGVQGEALAFNVTPKELWRAETDEAWILIAVTRVLSPGPIVNLVRRDQLAAGVRRITGYRVTL